MIPEGRDAGVFSSGQRVQAVDLLRLAAVVRIHPLPARKKHASACFFQRYKSTAWICDIRFACDIRLRRVICLRAWGDLYHITSRASEIFHLIFSSVRIHPSKTQIHLFRTPLTEKSTAKAVLFSTRFACAELYCASRSFGADRISLCGSAAKYHSISSTKSSSGFSVTFLNPNLSEIDTALPAFVYPIRYISITQKNNIPVKVYF